MFSASQQSPFIGGFAVLGLSLLLSACAQGTPISASRSAAVTFSAQSISQTLLGRGTSYTQLIRLANQSSAADNGRVMLAFEDLSGTGIPFYESTNDGSNWTLVTTVQDQNHAGQTGWKLEWQPFLYELPRAAGSLVKGTLLLAANCIHFDASGTVTDEQIQLYTSADLGRSWQFRSTVIAGTGDPSRTDNKAVWEPNVRVLDNGTLVTYYSTEQHKADGYNQLLAHKTSTDGGLTWSAETYDVAVGGGSERPGMAVTARLPSGGYVMTYEDVGGPVNGQTHMKFSADGLNWGAASDRGVAIQTSGGSSMASTPVVTWIPVGGPKGMLIVSSQNVLSSTSTERKLYWNDNSGQGPWWEMTAPVQTTSGNDHVGWTQGMLLQQDGATLLHAASSATSSDLNQNQIYYAAARLAPHRYQAENAALSDARAVAEGSASNGAKVGYIDNADSSATFTLNVDVAGTYPLLIRYGNGWGASSHNVSVNGGAVFTVNYANNGVNVWTSTSVNVDLNAGANTVKFSKGANFTELDYVELPTRLNDTLTGTGKDQFNYTGTWTAGGSCGDCFGGNDHYTNVANAAASLAFNGTQVRLYGAKAPGQGYAAISIDGGAETTVDLYSATRAGKQLYYTSPVLSAGPHTVRVRATGTHDASANDSFVTLDDADISN